MSDTQPISDITLEEQGVLERLLPEDSSGALPGESIDEQRILDRLLEELPGTDPGTQFITGEGLRGLIRGGLAFWGDTAAEKHRHFKESYPQGEIARNPDDGDLYYRKTSEGPFYKIDPSMFTDPGGWRDLPLDMLEFGAEEGPILAGEIAAFAAFRRPPVATANLARSLLGQVLNRARTRPGFLAEKPGVIEHTAKAGLGAAVGESSRQLAQTLAGVQSETIPEQLSRTAKIAAFSAGGEFAAKPFIKAVGALRGTPIAKLKERAGRAIAAEGRLALPHLTPGQTVRNPILARWQRMAGTISTSMGIHLDKQMTEARRLWSSLSRSDASPDAVTANIKRAVDNAENAIWRQANVRWKNLDSAGTGKAILRGVMLWDKLAKEEVGRLYNLAREAATPVYDITNLKNIANEVLEGVRFATPEGDSRIGIALHKAVRDVAETIGRLDPNLPGVSHADGRIDDATDQLRELRSQLYDLKTPNIGDVLRKENRDASRIYVALSKVMKDPALDRDGAREAWGAANTAADQRFMVLDKAIIAQVLKTDVKGGASMLARSLILRGKQSDLQDLKHVLPGADFQRISGFAAAEIFENPSLFKTMDPDVRSMLFTGADLRNMRATVDDLERIRTLGAGLTKAFDDNVVQRKGLSQFLLGATPRQIDEFLETVRSQPETLDFIRQTVIDSIADASRAGGKFDIRAFLGNLYKLKDSGLFRKGGLWTADQYKNINDLRRYMEVSSGLDQSDFGASLMAAEALSPTAVAEKGFKAFPAMLHKVLALGGFGRLLTSPLFSKVVRGRYRRRPAPGRALWNSDFIRGIAATLAADLGRSSEEERQ